MADRRLEMATPWVDKGDCSEVQGKPGWWTDRRLPSPTQPKGRPRVSRAAQRAAKIAARHAADAEKLGQSPRMAHLSSSAPDPADVKQINGVDKWVESQRTARERRAQKEAVTSDSRPLNVFEHLLRNPLNQCICATQSICAHEHTT